MNKVEYKLLTEVQRHYEMAKQDLDVRKEDFDTADELFRSYLDEKKWPYSSLIFVPRVFTTIFEKTSRLIGTKPRGRLVPREGGDVIGAKINYELLNYQWDDISRINSNPMIARWSMMDMNARKYGASFALCKWRYERKVVKDAKEGGTPEFKSKPYFDGPSFEVLNNRDVLANPSYSEIKGWFQHREYLTLAEMMGINDAARGKPIYRNLDELLEKIRHEMKTMDTRDTNSTSRNKQMKGQEDFLGRDEFNKTVEIITEYRENRWISFAPQHGVIIRDIPNPYDHQQIPVVMLKYYAIDDDLYGLPEWEPIEKLQKAVNAISSQYMDAVNMELYPVFGVDPTRVRLHTMDFSPRAKWIVTGNPNEAVARMDFSAPNSIGQFKTVYQMLIGEMQEAVGESSQMASNLDPFGGGEKTATEIKDTASQRLARDNFNQIFLGEAIKRQMMLWHFMNQQLLFKAGETEKIIRIVGRDAIRYFQDAGLSESGFTDDAMNQLAQAAEQGIEVNPSEFQTPLFPVGDSLGSLRPKMNIQGHGEMGELTVEPSDLDGNYDYIADIESMSPPNEEQLIMSKKIALDMIKDPVIQAQLAQQGKTVKVQELLEDYLEQLGFIDAGKYFDELQVQQPLNGNNQAGAGIAQAGAANMGNGQVQGMGSVQVPPGGQNQPLMARPA